MKNHRELVLLGAELLGRFSAEDTQKVVEGYRDELVAIALAALELIPVGGLPFLIIMLKTVFMLGYQAGQNSRAGDFKPQLWVVGEENED